MAKVRSCEEAARGSGHCLCKYDMLLNMSLCSHCLGLYDKGIQIMSMSHNVYLLIFSLLRIMKGTEKNSLLSSAVLSVK